MTVLLTMRAWIGFLMTATALMIGAAATITLIRNARGPRERRFVVFNSAAAGGVMVLLLVLMAVTPLPWSLLWLFLYFFHLPLAIYRFALKQQLIRVVEERERRHSS